MTWYYDDTFEGFLTTVFAIYKSKDTAPLIFKEQEAQLGLGVSQVVGTDVVRATRVKRKLESFAKELPHRLYCAWLSNEVNIEQQLFAFIQECISQNRDITSQHYRDNVIAVLAAARKVSSDAYQYTKFIRFFHVAPKVYLADIEPEYDILEMLTGEFEDRLEGCNFLIRDLKRRKCLVWNQVQYWVSYEEHLLEPRTPQAGNYEELWQTYFKHIAIPERINPKLQTLHVPKRYRKFMTEFASNPP